MLSSSAMATTHCLRCADRNCDQPCIRLSLGYEARKRLLSPEPASLRLPRCDGTGSDCAVAVPDLEGTMRTISSTATADC
jgi:hypothetical protein